MRWAFVFSSLARFPPCLLPPPNVTTVSVSSATSTAATHAAARSIQRLARSQLLCGLQCSAPTMRASLIFGPCFAIQTIAGQPATGRSITPTTTTSRTPPLWPSSINSRTIFMGLRRLAARRSNQISIVQAWNSSVTAAQANWPRRMSLASPRQTMRSLSITRRPTWISSPAMIAGVFERRALFRAANPAVCP